MAHITLYQGFFTHFVTFPESTLLRVNSRQCQVDRGRNLRLHLPGALQQNLVESTFLAWCLAFPYLLPMHKYSPGDCGDCQCVSRLYVGGFKASCGQNHPR